MGLAYFFFDLERLRLVLRGRVVRPGVGGRRLLVEVGGAWDTAALTAGFIAERVAAFVCGLKEFFCFGSGTLMVGRIMDVGINSRQGLESTAIKSVSWLPGSASKLFAAAQIGHSDRTASAPW